MTKLLKIEPPEMIQFLLSNKKPNFSVIWLDISDYLITQQGEIVKEKSVSWLKTLVRSKK